MVFNNQFLTYFGENYGDSGCSDHKEYKYQTKNKIRIDTLEHIIMHCWEKSY